MSFSERAARGLVAYEDFVESPIAFKPSPRQLYIVDQRAEGNARRWMSAGISMGVFFVTLLVMEFLDKWTVGIGGLLFGAIILAAAALMILIGIRTKRFRAVPLAWINGSRKLLKIREDPRKDGFAQSKNIYFNEIKEIIFAIRKTNVPGAPSKVGVEGAGVFIRLYSGTVWPVIPSTLKRDRAYNIAVQIAKKTHVGVKQVGLQWAEQGK